uniref:hypothetical protein n=1 Tax=Ezakiella massiliensis TaxID=1852374 RepID=UPI0013906685
MKRNSRARGGDPLANSSLIPPIPVIPAHAGVIPWSTVEFSIMISNSRARGGDPELQKINKEIPK